MQPGQGLQHHALLYRGGPAGFAEAIGPEVLDTLDAGGRAIVAAPPDRLTALEDRIGSQERVRLIDMTVLGANPARIIPAWREMADEADRPLLGVGEPVWAGRDADTLTECHRHEALINVAFAEDPTPWRLVCPYDAEALDPAVVADARRTHPVVHAVDGRFERTPVDARHFDTVLGPPPDRAETVRFSLDDLEHLRHLAVRHGTAAGLDPRRCDDVMLAVSEAATNSILHGGGGGTFSIWTVDHAVVAQTEDTGRISDPLIGRRRPTLEHPHGRGFWLMHQVCDLVQVRDTAAGTLVRLTLR